VSNALSEEIRRLPVLVYQFNVSFHTEQHDLIVYKEELCHHVENGLVSKLRATLSTAIDTDIKNSQREMTGNKLYAFNARYFILLVE